MGTKEHPSDFDCYSNAEPDEPMFTLLARDATAPDVVCSWADLREMRLRAKWDNETTVGEVMAELEQIAEARRCAEAMKDWRAEHRP